MAATCTGVAHCPEPVYLVGAEVTDIPAMDLRIGLGVDGTASNDNSKLMHCINSGYMLQCLVGATREHPVPEPSAFLHYFRQGGADLLSRKDIGTLAPGIAADLFAFDTRRLDYVGTRHDPASLIPKVGVGMPVDMTMINGRIVWRDGHFPGLDEGAMCAQAEAALHRIVTEVTKGNLTTKQNRRSLLKTTLAAGTALALPVPAFAADVLNVTLIVSSPAADVGWSHTLELGTKALEEEYGDKIKVTLLENIAEGPDADRIMNKTMADGTDFLILGSFGYMNVGLKLAAAHPEVSILHASGYQTAPNVSPFGARYYRGTYLMGMAAASLTKTKKLGCVGAFPIPEMITSTNAWALGAQSVDPSIEVTVVWVNLWFDPASEQNAAKALLSQGGGVILYYAQDTPSVVAACEAAGAYVFNINSS